jgi:hypothetical protein
MKPPGRAQARAMVPFLECGSLADGDCARFRRSVGPCAGGGSPRSRGPGKWRAWSRRGSGPASVQAWTLVSIGSAVLPMRAPAGRSAARGPLAASSAWPTLVNPADLHRAPLAFWVIVLAPDTRASAFKALLAEVHREVSVHLGLHFRAVRQILSGKGLSSRFGHLSSTIR